MGLSERRTSRNADRQAAFGALHAVLGKGIRLETALATEFEPLSDARDRAFAHHLTLTALRRRGQIADALAGLMRTPPHAGSPLEAILHLGAAQILFLDTPDHAAVSTSLALAERHRRTRSNKPLINAVLRNLVRTRDEVRTRQSSPARLNCPDWLFARWASTYGEATAVAIAEAHLHEPPLDLTARSGAEELAGRLGGVALNERSVRLYQAGSPTGLAGFSEGDWWVQDAAAALPAPLIAPAHGPRVLDLCSAPGGKTAQLAAAGAEVTAVDRSAQRLQRLTENLARLSLRARTVAADLLEWTPGDTYDAVLLDAPCSATGTVRRHPDLPWRRSSKDIEEGVKLQTLLLERAAGWVRPGGLLVYATCSLEPEEGEHQADRFLAAHSDFETLPIRAGEIGAPMDAIKAGRLRTLPCQSFPTASGEAAGLDGFFAVRLRRMSR